MCRMGDGLEASAALGRKIGQAITRLILSPMKIPSLDLSLCTLCLGCLEVAPSVFRLNEAAGYIEVVEMDAYPENDVDEAIKYCPEDAIVWENG